MPGSVPPLQVLLGSEPVHNWLTSVPGVTAMLFTVNVVPQSLAKVSVCGIIMNPVQSRKRFSVIS